MTTQQEFWSDTGRTSQGGETSGILLPTPQAFDSKREMFNAETMDSSRRHAKGGCSNLAESMPSISSVVDSPASLFRWLDVEKGTVISVGCGPLFAKWYESSDRDGYFLKMSGAYCQRTLDGSLEEYSETWPPSGSMQNGKCYRQQRLVLRISAKESSLLPTPQASEATHGGPNARDSSGALHLSAVAQLLPTPTADQYGSNQGGSAGREGQKKRPSIASMAGGLLNPQFVEAIMGLPIGWTDLED